jgi:hypothetical protein
MNATHVFEGGCHCGAVRFRVTIDEGQEIVDCNCSVCTKKGIVHLIVPEARFELLRGQETLTVYTFNTGVAKHMFCKVCGMHPFYRPRSHPDSWDVNVRCLDDVSVLERFPLRSFDGRNWEASIGEIRGAAQGDKGL